MEDPNLSALLVHEIANPVNNISAALYLMEECLTEERQPVGEAVGGILKLLQEETKRLALLLDRFRSLDSLALCPQPICLTDLVYHCLGMVSARATRRGVKILSDVPLELPLVDIDDLRFKQVIFNLCENAIDAMPNGGTLVIRGYLSQKYLCLDIIDSGDGISEEIDIFAPGVTTKGSGMGFGLFIVKRVISAHGGTISYTSKKGEGTTFRLSLPIDPH